MLRKWSGGCFDASSAVRVAAIGCLLPKVLVFIGHDKSIRSLLHYIVIELSNLGGRLV